MQQAKDFSQAFLFEKYDIRGELVCLNQIVKKVIDNRGYPKLVAELLGQLLASCALLRSMLQFNGNLLLQAKSEATIKLLVAEYNSSGAIRGMARYHNIDGTQDFTQLLQDGILVLTAEPKNGQRYQGIIALDKANLAKCLAQYFAKSQQLATFFLLDFRANCARGLLLQQLPAQLESYEQREQNWQYIIMSAQTLIPQELHSLTNTQILRRLFHQEDLRLFAPHNLHFACSCSRQRALNALLSLDKDELKKLLNEQQGIIEIDCEFCGVKQIFKESDLNLEQIH